jgi:hypothetical protein
MYKKKRVILFSLIIIFIALLAATIVVCVAQINGKTRLSFSATYYYVYYDMQDNALSASSISSAVQSFGGAGYIVESSGNYYITVACYYDESDALQVCKNLRAKLVNCDVLTVEVGELSAPKRYANNFVGILQTLHSLSQICYKAANGLDSGEYDESSAAAALDGVKTSLNGLIADCPNEEIASKLNYLSAVCGDISYGYIYSKNLRLAQIAITDVIANFNLN